MLLKFLEIVFVLCIFAETLPAAGKVVRQPSSKHYDGQRNTGSQEDLPGGLTGEVNDAGIPDRLGNCQLFLLQVFSELGLLPQRALLAGTGAS